MELIYSACKSRTNYWILILRHCESFLPQQFTLCWSGTCMSIRRHDLLSSKSAYSSVLKLLQSNNLDWSRSARIAGMSIRFMSWYAYFIVEGWTTLAARVQWTRKWSVKFLPRRRTSISVTIPIPLSAVMTKSSVFLPSCVAWLTCCVRLFTLQQTENQGPCYCN